MTSLHQANTPLYKTAVQDLHNPALLARTTDTADEDAQDIEKALRIAGVLQTTLDLSKVLDIFCAEVGRYVAINHMSYTNDDPTQRWSHGEPERHSVTYRMAVSDQSLGEVTFTRRRKFSAKENSVLEYLLCGLVYPLRNALAYGKALQAALKDPLTGVHNRTAMDQAMSREMDLSRRHGNPLTLIAVDIDFFKRVNDTYGHAAGDAVLRAVAASLVETVRGSDMVFRYGGEEFMVLLSNTSKKGALLLAERLRQKISQLEVSFGGKNVHVTVSLGVACLDSGDNGQGLFLRADKALYEAKSSGRNCVRYAVR